MRRVYGAPHIFETNHHLLSLPPSLVGVAVAYGGMECRARSPALSEGFLKRESGNERTGQKSDELRPRGHYGHASKGEGQDG